MFLYLFRVFTIIHYQIANLLKNNINFANWLSNLEFTIKSRPHYGFTIFTRIQSEFTIFCKFTLNSLSFLRIHYKFSNFIANQLWIYSIFRKFTIFYAIEVIPYESNVNNARIPVVFCEFIMNSFWSVNSLSITLINHEFTMNWLSFSGNHYKSTIFFANTLWIHFLWIHYLFRASTMIPFLFRELSIKRILREELSPTAYCFFQSGAAVPSAVIVFPGFQLFTAETVTISIMIYIEKIKTIFEFN